ncbi:hypothetical protein WICPIJ_009405 [Wickerhamomyces pijperi]|uniref:Uncharacterized protein n=1 Tax=Wickerhamomyces pijperi TaxID=599730 RepID=A0A9P8TDV7_WICPI|nr:hypothetical protein WICPIJ_009405 [Wickerhamomyces pijperi]
MAGLLKLLTTGGVFALFEILPFFVYVLFLGADVFFVVAVDGVFADTGTVCTGVGTDADAVGGVGVGIVDWIF